MRTCEECQFWKDLPYEWAKTIQVRTHKFGECHNPVIDELTAVYDDSLPLNTRQDFGCVLWRATE